VRGFLTFTTIVYGLFGLGLLAIPGPFLAPYGLDLNSAGQLMCRVLGSALIGLAITFWRTRGAQRTPAVAGLMQGSFLYNAVDTVALLVAMQRGELGVLAWGPIGLHLVMALGFGWFSFRR
jgi:hypothetical protein